MSMPPMCPNVHISYVICIPTTQGAGSGILPSSSPESIRWIMASHGQHNRDQTYHIHAIIEYVSNSNLNLYVLYRCIYKYVCIYTYMYMYMCTYIYIYVHVYIYIYIIYTKAHKAFQKEASDA